MNAASLLKVRNMGTDDNHKQAPSVHCLGKVIVVTCSFIPLPSAFQDVMFKVVLVGPSRHCSIGAA